MLNNPEPKENVVRLVIPVKLTTLPIVVIAGRLNKVAGNENTPVLGFPIPPPTVDKDVNSQVNNVVISIEISLATEVNAAKFKSVNNPFGKIKSPPTVCNADRLTVVQLAIAATKFPPTVVNSGNKYELALLADTFKAPPIVDKTGQLSDVNESQAPPNAPVILEKFSKFILVALTLEPALPFTVMTEDRSKNNSEGAVKFTVAPAKNCSPKTTEFT